ncbi:MarR family winged helix-turn-helix transcriptional regulator [Paraburkholderia pallida]|uniref:MarR family transcriptional regulator n=1 Tax=Paraburkholderia pallida TaxID=2547399 RepID=A0A4P7D0K0_9BURK|nr:MarR family winged helix-turn-helix transcriptional regulator [Paraburkholderia pallida]QBR01378.1 MarR family transcriptional regulator [Paraburkholderia pallida]
MELKHCNCASLRGATRAVSLAYDDALRPSGLRVTQFSILANVASAKEVSMGELADQIAMDRTTLARNLKPLERDKLIQVVVGEDRRERIVSVTATGRKTLERAIPLWRAVQTRFEEKVGKREAKRILELTQSLIRVGRELSAENG